MLKNLWHKIVFLVIAIMIGAGVFAQQNFKYVVALGEVQHPGFYRIELVPDVISYLQPQLQDIRVLDGRGKQVPYVLQIEKQGSGSESLLDLPIISKQTGPDSQSYIEIENPHKRPVRNLILFVKNTDATRTISISGSDNRVDWYIVKENVTLDDLYTDTSDTFAKEVFFPLSNYQYFKIIIQGKRILPLNIVRASVPVNHVQGNSSLTLLPLPSISQKDSSDGFSYIHLRFQREYQISKLSLQVKGARFFQRNLDILNGKVPYQIHTYRLSSNDSAIYRVDCKTNHLLLKIQNDDNAPLQLTRADAYQVHHSLVAWLEKGAGYRIVFGDSQALAPRYDLSFFKDSINSIPIALQQGKIKEIAGSLRNEDEDSAERKVWLWIALAFVLSILLFFSFRMTRELNKKA